MSVAGKYWQLAAGSIASIIYLIGEKDIRMDWVTLGLNEGLAIGEEKDDEPWRAMGQHGGKNNQAYNLIPRTNNPTKPEISGLSHNDRSPILLDGPTVTKKYVH